MKNKITITVEPTLTGIKLGLSIRIHLMTHDESININWIDIINLIDFLNTYLG